MTQGKCAGCGAPIRSGQVECEYCHTRVPEQPISTPFTGAFNQTGQTVGVQINTNGGAFVGGNVNTNGGGVFRDSIIVNGFFPHIEEPYKEPTSNNSGRVNVAGKTITVMDGVMYVNGKRVKDE